MADLAESLVKNRARLNEIAKVLAHHGLAAWAARGTGIAGVGPVEHLIDQRMAPEDLEASDGVPAPKRPERTGDHLDQVRSDAEPAPRRRR